MTDLTKLKELAERATPGRNFDRLPSAGGGLKYTCTGDDGSLVLRVDHKNDLFGFIGPKGEEDEAFFLACTPQAVLELIAEVDRLRRQVDHLINQHMPREPIPDMPGWTRVIDADRLKAENEELRKDAERYRWLRGQSFSFIFQTGCGDACITGSRSGYASRFKELAWVDAAIDAALEGGGR